MLRSSVNFILKLGKRSALQRGPLKHLGEVAEIPSSPLSSAREILHVAVKTGQPQHSNQMSS